MYVFNNIYTLLYLIDSGEVDADKLTVEDSVYVPSGPSTQPLLDPPSTFHQRRLQSTWGLETTGTLRDLYASLIHPRCTYPHKANYYTG